MFMTCAESGCPGLIQSDCARYGDDLDRVVPSVSFGARDGASTDLPHTTVYVDDQLVAMRLDDGKSYELDPGKHTVRFVHDGKESTMNVVLNQGERGEHRKPNADRRCPSRRPGKIAERQGRA